MIKESEGKMQEEAIVQVDKVEVELLKPFPIIRETLERIGIANRTTKKIFPSCYVNYSEDGKKTYICHFKELLKTPSMTESDVKRRNTIIWLCAKWGLVNILDATVKNEVTTNIQNKKIYILKKEQLIAEKWEIVHKLHLKYENRKGE